MQGINWGSHTDGVSLFFHLKRIFSWYSRGMNGNEEYNIIFIWIPRQTAHHILSSFEKILSRKLILINLDVMVCGFCSMESINVSIKDDFVCPDEISFNHYLWVKAFKCGSSCLWEYTSERQVTFVNLNNTGQLTCNAIKGRRILLELPCLSNSFMIENGKL